MNNKIINYKKLTKKNLTNTNIIIISLLLFIFIGFVTYQYLKIKKFDNLIYPKVSIEGINVSGKTKKEASKLINENYCNKLLNKKINLNDGNKIYTLKYSQLNPSTNINKVIDNAFNYGKNLSYIKKYYLINHKEKNFKLDFKYDEKNIDSFLSKISKSIKSNPKDASVTLNKGKIKIINEQNGKTLNKEKSREKIIALITSKNLNNVTKPLVINETKPRITADKLSEIDTKIATHSTNYKDDGSDSESTPERATNLKLAAKAINGTLLMPGDIFSFNNIVGNTTADKGYKNAPIIVNNQFRPGMGGGICQVSTTLFTAVDKANLESIERISHSLPVYYAKKRRDVAIAFGSIDYKFKNTYSYPIYIESYAKNGKVVVNIYSKKK